MDNILKQKIPERSSLKSQGLHHNNITVITIMFEIPALKCLSLRHTYKGVTQLHVSNINSHQSIVWMTEIESYHVLVTVHMVQKYR